MLFIILVVELTIATECGVGPVISRVLRVLTAVSSIRTMSDASLQFIGYHGNKITRLHVTFISLLIIIGLGALAPGRVSCAKGKVGFRSGEMAGKGGANFIPSYLNVFSKILQYIWRNI